MTSESKAGSNKAGTIKQRASRAGSAAGAKLRSGSAAARAVSEKAGESVGAYPVVALMGGLAVGAVLGALLPRTRQEEELLGSIGGALSDKAKGAASAAREAGQAKLGELGISSDAAGKQVGKLIESIAKVAETAGSAAVDAIRH